jgi:hypothetical protein
MYSSLKLCSNTDTNQNPNAANNCDTVNALNYHEQLPVFSTCVNVTNTMLYPSLVNSTNIQIPHNSLYQSQHIPFQNFGAQVNWLTTQTHFNSFQTSLPQQAYMNPLIFPQQDPSQSESENKSSNSTT